MEITHDLLLHLGFVKSPSGQHRYSYKMVVGHLVPETGLFLFHGFTPGIGTVADLRYLLMLIDYRFESSFNPYPGINNQ